MTSSQTQQVVPETQPSGRAACAQSLPCSVPRALAPFSTLSHILPWSRGTLVAVTIIFYALPSQGRTWYKTSTRKPEDPSFDTEGGGRRAALPVAYCSFLAPSLPTNGFASKLRWAIPPGVPVTTLHPALESHVLITETIKMGKHVQGPAWP